MPKNKAAGPMKPGRPRKDTRRARYYDGKLYAVLIKAFPNHLDGKRLNVGKLATDLSMARQSLYRWMENDAITPEVAKLLIAKTKDTPSELTKEDLVPFVFQ